MNDALANTPMDERTTAQLQQRIQDLEQQLVDVQAHQVAVEQNARRDYATLLQGPFIIFRWIAVEGWPVEYVSENVQTLFGYAAEDFTSGRVAFASVVLPDDLERVFEEVQTYSASGVRSFDQEYRIVRSNGEIRWIYDFTAVNRNEDGVITHYYGYVLDITTRKQVEVEQAMLQQRLIDAQQAALQELSTPLIPVSANAVVMPLIGTIDSRRAEEVLQTLLYGVVEQGATTAIIDITGVQVVDTRVANVFLQAAQAVQLLGADVVLTGIRPEVAQTLVSLGVDLRGIITRSTLQDGIAYAMRATNT